MQVLKKKKKKSLQFHSGEVDPVTGIISSKLCNSPPQKLKLKQPDIVKQVLLAWNNVS